MKKSLISIIVPVYKCEKYLESCICSILAQTYSNLEILLIDDGSPDSCPVICDAFTKKDKRIKVFHKTNGGVSSARNVGIDYSKGDYICFVDSDDILPKNAIFDLWEGITNNSCQYVAGICGILNSNKTKNNISFEQIIDYMENPEELLNYIKQSGSYSPYAKIYDAHVIRKYGLRYNEDLTCSEDALFIRRYLSYCSKIALIPKIVYIYNTGNEQSLSKKFHPDFCFYYAKKMEALEELIRKLPISEYVKRDFIFDRAVHGLKISIHHYMINSDNREEELVLIGKTINILDKWIVEQRELSSNKEWWDKYAYAVKNRDVEKIWKYSHKEIKKENMICRLKLILKKMVRGIRK